MRKRPSLACKKVTYDSRKRDLRRKAFVQEDVMEEQEEYDKGRYLVIRTLVLIGAYDLD